MPRRAPSVSDLPTRRSSRGDIDRFITRSRDLAPRSAREPESGAGRPRLLFSIDATASRQPTWDVACDIQARMFMSTRDLGGLAVQLCYYRGYGELRASRWLLDETELLRLMSRVRCEGGLTQIGRLLDHGLREHRARAVRGLVFIGDAVEESVDGLCHKAGECGLRELPLFLFQEGGERRVENCFRGMARLSGGAYARFDRRSPAQLADLLGAVASYAAAGTQGLLRHGAAGGAGARLLLEQLATPER